MSEKKYASEEQVEILAERIAEKYGKSLEWARKNVIAALKEKGIEIIDAEISMSEKIRQAQVQAGEQAVIENLKKLRLSK